MSDGLDEGTEGSFLAVYEFDRADLNGFGLAWRDPVEAVLGAGTFEVDDEQCFHSQSYIGCCHLSRINGRIVGRIWL